MGHTEMPLADCQIQVRTLVMGPGTNYDVLSDFDPWSRQVRADQGGPRAWNHGAWSGAEWQAEAVVPIRVRVRDAANKTPAGWLAAHRLLAAAFAPSHDDLEMRFVLGGVEYVLFGRPRMVEPEAVMVRRGSVITRAAFVALDPLIYSGAAHVLALVLPTTSGGLSVPITVPITIGATVVGNSASITNAGTADVGLTLRIDGPVQEPRVSLLAGGVSSVLRFALTLTTGQWLDVDTAARTTYMNGTASRRGQTFGQWPMLPSGSHEVAFDAAAYDAAAALTVTFRDGWY